MESMGVIKKITEPSEWCAVIVIVTKSTGAVRISNRSIPVCCGNLIQSQRVDETLAQLSGAIIFSKVDANSGYCQIPLAAIYSFYISIWSILFLEVAIWHFKHSGTFQSRISCVLDGLMGVLCHMDVLIHGMTQQEHDQQLTATLQWLESAGVTLNLSKCEFGVNHVKFLGHIIDKDGVWADPDKVFAVVDMKAPSNVPELRRFLGLITHLGKFFPKLAEISQSLRQLLTNLVKYRHDHITWYVCYHVINAVDLLVSHA